MPIDEMILAARGARMKADRLRGEATKATRVAEAADNEARQLDCDAHAALDRWMYADMDGTDAS